MLMDSIFAPRRAALRRFRAPITRDVPLRLMVQFHCEFHSFNFAERISRGNQEHPSLAGTEVDKCVFFEIVDRQMLEHLPRDRRPRGKVVEARPAIACERELV